jgi:hypothetical protein
VNDCLQVSSRFARRADRDSDMATEGRRYAGKKSPELMSTVERDEELAKIRARKDELKLRMQWNARSRWVYEWTMKTKIKLPVKQMMVTRQCRLLRGWMRQAENLNRSEEGVQICETETGRNLSDAEDEMGSAENLKHCQEGREEIPNCQVGKS